MKLVFKFIVIFLYLISLSVANEVNVFEFTQKELETLDKRKVKGETLWTLGSNENGNYIRAEVLISS